MTNKVVLCVFNNLRYMQETLVGSGKLFHTKVEVGTSQESYNLLFTVHISCY